MMTSNDEAGTDTQDCLAIEVERLEFENHVLVRMYNDLKNRNNVIVQDLTSGAVSTATIGMRSNLITPMFFDRKSDSVQSSKAGPSLDYRAESEKFISFKYHFMFFGVPKVASQTMIVTLKNYCDNQEFVHSSESYSVLREKYPEIEEFFKFSVVRHPFSRLVSCYIDKVLNVTTPKRTMLGKAGWSQLPVSFCSFVDMVLHPPRADLVPNSHWAEQVGVLSSPEGELLVDAVAHVENLERDLKAIFTHVGLRPLAFKKTKNTRKQHLEVCGVNADEFNDQFFWSDVIEKKIQSKYKSDYYSFNYLPYGKDAVSLSVVVCTYNRFHCLQRCVHALIDQLTLAGHGKVELLIIDNNSTDETEDFLNILSAQYGWLSYHKEPRQGLSYARNCGAQHAQGSYVAYIDDDAIPDDGFISNLLDALHTHQPDVLGGPIYPFYESSKSFWFQDALETRKYAESSGYFSGFVSGGNFAIRKQLLIDLGLFSTELGMQGNKLRLGEERELLERYKALTPQTQQRIYYAVECAVRHLVPSSKMTFSYLIKRSFESGRMRVQLRKHTQQVLTERALTPVKKRIGLLKRIVIGRSGIYLPIRIVHWFAILVGILYQKLLDIVIRREASYER